jgi:PAS domain S-box-containing protein
MTEPSQDWDERQTVVAILREHREDIVARWLTKVQTLMRERELAHTVQEDVLLEEAHEFLERLCRHLLHEEVEGDAVVFHHLVLGGRSHHIRLADIAYVLLELKTACKQTIFAHIDNELTAFRTSRMVEEAVEGVLRRSADIYETTNAADHDSAQQRLEEIFAAWDVEEALAAAQTVGDVCRIAREKLGAIWSVAGMRLLLCTGEGRRPREVELGTEMPVPLVEELGGPLASGGRSIGGTVSLMDRVRAGQKPYLCTDLARDAELLNKPELLRAGVGSLACHQLTAQDRTVGVLLLYSRETEAFTERSKRQLLDFAAVLGLALDRVGRIQESLKELTEAEVIKAIGMSLLERPTGTELLQAVALSLQEFRDYFHVSLFSVDSGKGVCRLLAESAPGGPFLPVDYEQPIGVGILGFCAQVGKTIRSHDPERDSHRIVAFEQEHRTRSELAVPVMKGAEVLGVMHFLSERPNDFSDESVAALEHAAPHIGVALRNADMIRQGRRDRHEIERMHHQLADVIRSADMGITSIDAQGVYTNWSPGCEAMLGYSEAEMVAHRTPADIAAEPLDLRAFLQHCVEEGQATTERRVLHKDGTSRFIRETRVPIEDAGGRLTGFTSYVMDVTEQKLAERKLRQEHDALRVVVDAMGAGLALYDRQMQLHWANSIIMKWFGFGPEAIGHTCHEVYNCHHAGGKRCLLQDAWHTGEAVIRTLEMTDEAGQWHRYQQIATPVTQGETRMVVLTLDITEQSRREDQMRLINKLTQKIESTLEPDEVLHLVLTCVTAGHAIGFNRAFMFLVGEDGSLDGRMAVGPTSADDAMRIWGGLDESEHTIDDLLEVAEPSESDAQLTLRVRHLNIPLDVEDDTIVRTLARRTSAHVGDARSDSHLRPELCRWLELEEFACVPLSARNKPLGVIIADNKYSPMPIQREQVELLELFGRQASLAIANARAYQRIRTQLKELEAARDRIIEAERLASVGHVASHLAHEIRNSLATIGGVAASIERRSRDDENIHRKAEIIFDESARLEDALVNVLDFTRKPHPVKSQVDVNAIVLDTIEQYQPRFDEEDILLRLGLDEDAPLINADGAMVKQVLINLIKNALEATAERQDRELSVVTLGQTDHVRVLVADNGSGMDDATLRELFSPFFSTKVGGVGIGLSVSQQIAREHGGRIEVASEFGHGATFTLCLPVTGERLPEPASATEHTEEQERHGDHTDC